MLSTAVSRVGGVRSIHRCINGILHFFFSMLEAGSTAVLLLFGNITPQLLSY